MYRKRFGNIIFGILLLMLSGCGDAIKCIEPDDFGFQTLQIQSKPPSSQIHTITSPPTPEYADWVNTGYQTNGEDIMLVVKNNYSATGVCQTITLNPTFGWTAWYGSLQSGVGEFLYNSVCQSNGGSQNSCSNTCWCSDVKNGYTIANPPCVFTQGVGAYAMLYNGDPASVPAASAKGVNPGTIYHLGIGSHCNNSNYFNGNQTSPVDMYDSDCKTGGLYLASSQIPSTCATKACNLYVKIQDQIYEDNFGSYQVLVKSGFQTTKSGPFTWLVNKVKSVLMGTPATSTSPAVPGASEKIYNQLVTTIGYVRIMLVLYVIISAVSFLIGAIEITQKDLVIRVLKMALVIQLTSSSSWNFFNNYLFMIFTNGIDQIAAMMSVLSSQTGSSGPPSVFSLFDNLINMVFSDQVWTKLIALIFQGAGFLFIITFYVGAVCAVYAAFRATLVYLIAYLVICLLIILGPIFVPFILFSFTKKLFDNWLGQLMTYFVQPLVILAMATILCDLIISKIYYILGVRVCRTFLYSIFGENVYWWKPMTPDSERTAKILIPGGNCSDATVGTTDVFGKDGGICPPLEYYGERYLDAPYLDMNLTADQNKFANLEAGTFVDFSDVAVFALVIILLIRFSTIVPGIAKILAGNAFGQLTDISSAGAMVFSNISKAGYSALNTISTPVSALVNAKIAVSKARKEGRSGIAAGLNAMINTKDVDSEKFIGNAINKSIVHKWQDAIGGSKPVKAVDDFTDKENLKKLYNNTTLIALPARTLGLLARGSYEAVRAGKDLNKIGLSVENLKAVGTNWRERVKATDEKISGMITYKNVAKLAVHVPTRLMVGAVSSTVGGAVQIAQSGFSTAGANAWWQKVRTADSLTAAGLNIAGSVGSGAASTIFNKDNVHAALLKASEATKGERKATLPFRTKLVSMALSGAANSLKYYTSSAEEKRAIKKDLDDRNLKYIYQDRVGGILDNFVENKLARASDTLYAFTGGAFGTDMNEKLKGQENKSEQEKLTRADLIRAQHEINEENWEEKFSDPMIKNWKVTKGLKTARNWAASKILNNGNTSMTSE